MGTARAQQTIQGAITHDEMQRSYILYTPSTYDGSVSAPLVLNFHGFGGSAAGQMSNGDFRPLAEMYGFLVVHPQGTRLLGIPHWNVGGWTIGSTTDDVGFIDALIDSLSLDYNIDPKRIYSTGMSNGGYMSFLLACQLSDRIAAVASVTGSMTTETYDQCIPQRPVPVLQIHGTSDGTVPYQGDTWTKSIIDVLNYWVVVNQCSTAGDTTALPNLDPGDGSTVQHIVFTGGDNGVTVEHFKVTGGGHTWPGSSRGNANQDIDASERIWAFFSQFDINGAIVSTDARTSVAAMPDEIVLEQNYPNPFRPTTTIQFHLRRAATVNLSVFDVYGREVRRLLEDDRRNAGAHTTGFDGSGLTPGVYFYSLETAELRHLRKMVLLR
jgi:polyhydroxybutyrate depolymerase